MADNISYDSNEISGIVSKIADHTNLIQSDIDYSINQDFSML